MLKRIISGGQTGADQGFLEGARRVGIATGGTAPLYYRTEKGTEADLLRSYGLVESPYWTYPPRTEQNVKDSDGTIWLGDTKSAGYKCTIKACKKFGKEWDIYLDPERLAEWILEWNIQILNGAGHRESTHPGIYQRAIDLVITTFGRGDD